MPTTLSLNSGHAIPVLGLGTFQATKPGEVKAAVVAAITAGCRLIDCAAGYGNQAEIGEALSEVVAAGVCTREELFIVSKLFQTHHAWDGEGYARCVETLEKTLADLQLKYLDCYLIHWPFAFAEKVLEKPLGTPQPLRLPDGSPNPIWTIKVEYTKTWRALEGFVDAGKTRSIGVSNFTQQQLEHLCSVARIPPAVNQIELHPYLSQRELVNFCEGKGIRVMGYSPLGSSATDRVPEAHGSPLLKHPSVARVAEECGKTPAQVLIRWALQRYATNLISIPKSSNAERIALNVAAGDGSWSLSGEQIAAIDSLDCGFRYFISYLKRPENEKRWHDGEAVETGTDADYVSRPAASDSVGSRL
jgi:alcohol dehydrogenase (NADP+)